MSPAVLVLLAAVLFGTTGTASALGPDELSPVAAGAGRVVLGGALLVAIAALGPGTRPRGWSAATAAAAVTGGAGVVGYQVCFFAAVESAGVGVGTIVTIGSAPAFTGLVGWLVGQGRPGGAWLAATTLAAAGCVLLVGAGGSGGPGGPGEAAALNGVLLALAAGASYAVYTLASKRLLDDGHPPVAVMAVVFGLGGLALLPVLATAELATLANPDALAVIVYLAVVPTAVAYLLFAAGLTRLSAATVATLTLAEPVVAAILGAVVLHEDVTGPRVAGATLVVAGLAVLARETRGSSLPAPASAYGVPG